MSSPDESRPPSARQDAGSRPKLRREDQGGSPRNAVFLWAGTVVFVGVGGVALGWSLPALTGGCASNSTGLPLEGSALCGNAILAGALEALVAGVAFVVGLLLLGRAGIPAVRRVPMAVVMLVAVALFVAAVSAAVGPPAASIVASPELSFPMPAGTTFTATQGAFGAFAEAAIPPDPYVPRAIIELQGAWNASSTVCLAVIRAQGSTLGRGLGVVCGTALSFVFLLDATTYVFAFYVPSGNATSTRAQVVITGDVHIVY